MLWVKVQVKQTELKEGTVNVKITEDVDPNDKEALLAATIRTLVSQRYNLANLNSLETYMRCLPEVEVIGYCYGDENKPELERPVKFESDD